MCYTQGMKVFIALVLVCMAAGGATLLLLQPTPLVALDTPTSAPTATLPATPAPTPTTAPTATPQGIAGYFPPTVRYWQRHIDGWAMLHDVDPDIIATIMLLESCGDPLLVSSAGASGLFQVMPFHFEPGENSFDPHVNAQRGLGYLNSCLLRAGGDLGGALVCYNGGASRMDMPTAQLPTETQIYLFWGKRLYFDAKLQHDTSATYDKWRLQRGGSCVSAARNLGIRGME